MHTEDNLHCAVILFVVIYIQICNESTLPVAIFGLQTPFVRLLLGFIVFVGLSDGIALRKKLLGSCDGEGFAVRPNAVGTVLGIGGAVVLKGTDVVGLRSRGTGLGVGYTVRDGCAVATVVVGTSCSAVG
jgi:hypothetical protein